MELATDIPTVSTDTTPPPKNDKPPLNLTLKVRADRLDLLTGVPGDLVKTIMNKNKDYDYDGLHTFLVALKGQHPHENTIVFEPIREVDYQVVVSIMDAVRTFRFDDPQIVKVDPVTGVEEPMKSLFDDIVFGNIEGK
jgi:biopolymer transport protein ExbD